MHPMLNTAIKAARKAGNVINRASMDLERVMVSRKGHNDFVTEVDKLAEQVIVETLLQAYPSHAVLGEEGGESGAEQREGHEYTWIIDPLDGTTNFIHGFPQYAVSIALRHNGAIEQAVVYDPTRNELFTASRGAGAFLNEKRIRVAKRTRLSEALIGTGFPFRAREGEKSLHLDEYLKLFRIMTVRAAGLRRPGAAALDLAYVAAGRLDGFWEAGLKPWDIAAGNLLILEAGGLVGDWSGEQTHFECGDVVAGSPKIFAQLIATIAEAR
ncbi:MAG TPA: inositol monophosphatase family protein [Burkholderiaceae bacterium]|nr:inositol monophosphatase family protein [Burkholderiaceae bacterium]